MITDIEYRDDIKEREEDIIDVNMSNTANTSSHQLNMIDEQIREQKIIDLSHRVQRYCRKSYLPIFNQANVTTILMNFFGQ